MRENGCDSTLPGSTRCSLILLIETHATTTNIMRNVEYITNGFGATPQRAYVPEVLSSIRQALPGAPDIVIKAALATFDKFGPAGFQRTANFLEALPYTDNALLRLFPNIFSQPISGAKFKRLFNSLLNTAASRAGLTPLSSIIIQGYREILQEIDDRNPNALSTWQGLKGTIPSWMNSNFSMRSLARSLEGGF
jgi:hypothetical protein